MNIIDTKELLMSVIKKGHLLKKEEMINKTLNETIFSDSQEDRETKRSDMVLPGRRR